jgi:hypothetical protein
MGSVLIYNLFIEYIVMTIKYSFFDAKNMIDTRICKKFRNVVYEWHNAFSKDKTDILNVDNQGKWLSGELSHS